jgi:hypothetical protein
MTDRISSEDGLVFLFGFARGFLQVRVRGVLQLRAALELLELPEALRPFAVVARLARGRGIRLVTVMRLAVRLLLRGVVCLPGLFFLCIAFLSSVLVDCVATAPCLGQMTA